MKLHWSPRSPFVRKVMIAAHELGLTDRLDCVRTVVHPLKPHEGLIPDNPLIKLPTLVLDDGTPVYDSRVICEYLDTISDRVTLFPQAWPVRLAALRDQATGDGLMDVALLWLMERIGSEDDQRKGMMAAFERKFTATLDRLEADIPTIAARPFDIGQLTIGVALLYLDFRFSSFGWRDTRPHLSAWHESFAQRPSVVANPARDD